MEYHARRSEEFSILPFSVYWTQCFYSKIQVDWMQQRFIRPSLLKAAAVTAIVMD